MRRILVRRRGILVDNAVLSRHLRHDPAELPVGDDGRRRRRHGPSVVHHRFFEHRIPLDGGRHGELFVVVVVVVIIIMIMIDLER